MSKHNYKTKFDSFISNNADLIGEYESIENSLPIDYCQDEIISFSQKILKANKTLDFNSMLRDAFTNAIRCNINVIDSLEAIMVEASNNKSISSTSQYFKEVNDIYNKHGNDYNIEYIPENRDKLIEMNLKTVISIAKRYQGLGLSLQELISAGNLGLVIAYDKFDPSRSKLKDDMLDVINKEEIENFEYNEVLELLQPYMTYGDIKAKFDKFFAEKTMYPRHTIIKWINSNIYNAKFNSIAVMWIRAYILIEIDNHSRIVKKPKVEIYKDREKHGAYIKEVTADIDAPISGDTDTALGDLLTIEDDTAADLEVAEAYDIYKAGLEKLLDGVKLRDRTIFLKRFGIGLPRPMTPKEIADQEKLSIARISQIFQNVMLSVQDNQVKFGIEPGLLFDAVHKFR